MDWKFVYDTYPVNRELIWLNNCGITPAGTHIVQAVSRFLKGYAEKGILTETASYQEVRRNIKKILAGLLKCQPEELSLTHNTAEGMNFISHGPPERKQYCCGRAPGTNSLLAAHLYFSLPT